MATTFATASFARCSKTINDNLAYMCDPSVITVTALPQEFRIPTLGEAFLEASTDPFSKSRGKRFYDASALWQEVTSKNGDVDTDTARQFVNDCLSGVFANDIRITDPRARQGLNTLGFETVITLYEKISKSDAKGNSLYLRELNRALDLPDTFYEKRIETVSRLFDDSQRAWMEQKWQQALTDGRLPAHAGNFADAMAEELENRPIWSAADAKRRIQLLQFLCDCFSDSLGETRVKMGLFNGKPGLKGFYMHQTDQNPEVIGLNVTEISNFQACVGIIMHERQHASQQRLADAYRSGKIAKTHPDYMAARVFAANGDNGGYINGDKDAGMNGYRFQPLEQDAHNAGSVAEYMVYKTYARKPGIYTERHVRPNPAAPAQRLAS